MDDTGIEPGTTGLGGRYAPAWEVPPAGRTRYHRLLMYTGRMQCFYGVNSEVWSVSE